MGQQWFNDFPLFVASTARVWHLFLILPSLPRSQMGSISKILINEEQRVAIIIFPPNLDTLVLLVLKNILLFFFILRVASEDQILNMAFEQIEAFLKKMQSEPELKNEVLAAPTADDIARIALKLGFEFSGDELLRMSGKKVGSITVRKTDLPGEYN